MNDAYRKHQASLHWTKTRRYSLFSGLDPRVCRYEADRRQKLDICKHVARHQEGQFNTHQLPDQGCAKDDQHPAVRFCFNKAAGLVQNERTTWRMSRAKETETTNQQGQPRQASCSDSMSCPKHRQQDNAQPDGYRTKLHRLELLSKTGRRRGLKHQVRRSIEKSGDRDLGCQTFFRPFLNSVTSGSPQVLPSHQKRDSAS